VFLKIDPLVADVGLPLRTHTALQRYYVFFTDEAGCFLSETQFRFSFLAET